MPKSAKRASPSTARFAKVVADCGTPELVVLWGEPTKSFLAADKQDRVMTVLQPVVGSQKDYGLVGFQPGKSASYLLFPKPLTKFKDARIIGIKYDLVETAAETGGLVTTPQRPAKPKPTSPKKESPTETSDESLRSETPTSPVPPSAPATPRKTAYEVTVRFRAEVVLTERVVATSSAEARTLAEEQAKEPNLSEAPVERQITGVKRLEHS